MNFDYCDNVELLSNTIPKNTKHLYFGNSFNQKVDMVPPSITCLGFGHNFNQSVDKLPTSITDLCFGHSFNQSVDMLPPSITHLGFGHNFNQSVNMLPTSITHLGFGHNFNQKVDMLPPTIITLGFGHNFNQSVNMLPPSIKHLHFFNKCLLKIFHGSNRIHRIHKNSNVYGYVLKKEKCIKNENTPFSEHKITFDMIHKKKEKLFYNIKKIPYGCVYDSIVYI